MTIKEVKRLRGFSRKVWNGLTKEEQECFYYDTGTIGFVVHVAKLLHIKIKADDYEVLDAVQQYATEVKK